MAGTRLSSQPGGETLQAILDYALNGIVVVDRDGRIVAFNRAAERVTLVPAADALGEHVDEVVPDTGLLGVMERGLPEYAAQLEIGSRLCICNRAPILNNGGVTGAVAVFQDINDLRPLMEELTATRASLETLEAIVDHAWDWIVVVDKNGIITMINQAYCDFLGLTREEAVGSHVTKIIENTRMHVVVQTGIPEIGHAQKIKGQEMICMRIPIKKDGKVIGAVGKSIFKDVGELRQLAQRLHILQSKVEHYERELRSIRGARYSLDDIIGNSPAIVSAKDMIQKAARHASNVLITGETGSGKELAAHAIHWLSPRAQGPFIRVNCAAIPKELLESELFGYEPGAFTGANRAGKPGKFELARGGTIFLDEIGDMPLEMQAKLLRVIQEREFERVGGVESIRSDTRIVCATNRDLRQLVSEGKFRLDLYYRLNVLAINMPPLRDRREDIPLLVHYLCGKISNDAGITPKPVSAAALDALRNYTWPGNVRELSNVLEKMMTIVEDDLIDVCHLPPNIQRCAGEAPPQPSGGLRLRVNDLEKDAILAALDAAGGNRKKAAQILGLPRSAFYRRMHKHGLIGHRSAVTMN